MAAHGLHQEVRQWSSKDNHIVAGEYINNLLLIKSNILLYEFPVSPVVVFLKLLGFKALKIL